MTQRQVTGAIVLRGIFEVLDEKTGGKNGKVVIANKTSKKATFTSFDITWE
jgi:hypothetical protein